MVSGWWWWWLEVPLLLIMATLRMVTAQNCSHFEADCGFEKSCKMIGLHFGWPAIDCDQKVYISWSNFDVWWLHQLHNRWDRLMVSSRSPTWNPLLAAAWPFYSVCIDTRPSFLSITDMWSIWCHFWQQPDLLYRQARRSSQRKSAKGDAVKFLSLTDDEIISVTGV